jgi:hypothetical protein
VWVIDSWGVPATRRPTTDWQSAAFGYSPIRVLARPISLGSPGSD